jgi:hypothetical protein
MDKYYEITGEKLDKDTLSCNECNEEGEKILKVATVRISELGTNCWLPARFCGGKCQRAMRCTYPEKKTCKAIDAEIEYLTKRREQLGKAIDKAISELNRRRQ